MPSAATAVNSRGRMALSYAEREELAGANPLPPFAGSLAGFADPHPFRELTCGLGASQCATCFGWFEDVRHPYARVMANA